MNEYYDYGRDFERELECEMEKWNCGYRTPEVLHNIKNLLKVITLCQEKEAGEAMRDYLEDDYGYDSRTGDFRERMKYNPYSVYNMADPKMPMRSGDKDASGYRRDTSYRQGDNRRGYDRDSNRSDYRRDYDGSDRDMRSRERDMYGIWNHGDESKMKEKMKPKNLDDKEYDKWMEEMEGADGTKGPMWNEEETTSLAKKVGVDFNKFSKKAYQTAVNMMYSDYCEVLEKYGINKPEVYAALAKAFLDDEDSIKGGEKLSAYYEYIVE